MERYLEKQKIKVGVRVTGREVLMPVFWLDFTDKPGFKGVEQPEDDPFRELKELHHDPDILTMLQLEEDGLMYTFLLYPKKNIEEGQVGSLILKTERGDSAEIGLWLVEAKDSTSMMDETWV